jgi:predicted PurR-regulated permease PerM
MEERWKWPRPLTAILLLTLVSLAFIGVFAWLGPILYEQSTMLLNKLPEYLRTLSAAYQIDSGSVINQLEESARQLQFDPQKILGQVFKTTGHALGIVTFIFSSATYVVLAIVLFYIYVFFFSWHFNTGLAKLSGYVPASSKERIFSVVAKMDDAVGDFFRGRLLIALLMGMLLSAGWFLVGVPYWFFLGMLTGLLNVVPYLSVVVWPIAILLKYLDVLTTGAGDNLGVLAIVVWPSVVYIAVQFLEGWFLTPWIQSGQTHMSAVTIILVVLIGGTVAGILGMLLAIPVAACIKILFEEAILPSLRKWAASH